MSDGTNFPLSHSHQDTQGLICLSVGCRKNRTQTNSEENIWPHILGADLHFMYHIVIFLANKIPPYGKMIKVPQAGGPRGLHLSSTPSTAAHKGRHNLAIQHLMQSLIYLSDYGKWSKDTLLQWARSRTFETNFQMEKRILGGNHEAVKHFLNNSGKAPVIPMLSKKPTRKVIFKVRISSGQ